MIDESEIGVDSPDNGDGIKCRVHVTSAGGAANRTVRIGALPGNAVRVSISFGRSSKAKASARVLVFVDPLTGKGVVRMGMYDTSKSTSGRETGKQLVWETDTPVWKGK